MKTLQQSHNCARAPPFFPPHFAARQAWDLDAKACHTIIKELDPKWTRTTAQHLAVQGYIKVSPALCLQLCTLLPLLRTHLSNHPSISRSLSPLVRFQLFAVLASLIFSLRSENNEYYQHERELLMIPALSLKSLTEIIMEDVLQPCHRSIITWHLRGEHMLRIVWLIWFCNPIDSSVTHGGHMLFRRRWLASYQRHFYVW